MIDRWLVRLYPAGWRARYGEEFLDLLENRPPNLRSVVDVLSGALDAHLNPQLVAGEDPFLNRRLPMSTRLLGAAAVASGLVLVLGLVIAVDEGLIPYRLVLFYTLAMAGMVGVHRRQVAAAPALAWLGFAPAVTFAGLALLAVLVSMTGGTLPSLLDRQFGFVVGASFWISCMVLGIVTAVIGVGPRLGAVAMAVGAPLAMIGMFDPGSPWYLAAYAGVVLFGLGLMWLGLSLVAGRQSPHAMPG